MSGKWAGKWGDAFPYPRHPGRCIGRSQEDLGVPWGQYRGGRRVSWVDVVGVWEAVDLIWHIPY